MIAGKIIAGLLGLAVAGPIGVLIGIYVGHQFDKGLGGLRPMSARQQVEVREAFFEAVFSLLGHLAKADGRVSEVEISHAQGLMGKMGLNAAHRKKAIELFKTGSQSGFSIDATMDRFMAVCGRQNNLKRSLLNYLISLAIADGDLHRAEQNVLRKIAGRLGFSGALFDQLINMIKAQSQFRESGGGSGTPKPQNPSEMKTRKNNYLVRNNLSLERATPSGLPTVPFPIRHSRQTSQQAANQ